MSMFRTALRSSARAAGALSASSRIASVRSTPTQWHKSSNGARNEPHMAQWHLYKRSWPFPAMSRASGKLLAKANSSEVAFRDGALTSRLSTAATNHTRHRQHCHPQLCRRCEGVTNRGVFHPRAEDPWCAGGGWFGRDRPRLVCRVGTIKLYCTSKNGLTHSEVTVSRVYTA